MVSVPLSPSVHHILNCLFKLFGFFPHLLDKIIVIDGSDGRQHFFVVPESGLPERIVIIFFAGFVNNPATADCEDSSVVKAKDKSTDLDIFMDAPFSLDRSILEDYQNFSEKWGIFTGGKRVSKL